MDHASFGTDEASRARKKRSGRVIGRFLSVVSQSGGDDERAVPAWGRRWLMSWRRFIGFGGKAAHIFLTAVFFLVPFLADFFAAFFATFLTAFFAAAAFFLATVRPPDRANGDLIAAGLPGLIRQPSHSLRNCARLLNRERRCMLQSSLSFVVIRCLLPRHARVVSRFALIIPTTNSIDIMKTCFQFGLILRFSKFLATLFCTVRATFQGIFFSARFNCSHRALRISSCGARTLQTLHAAGTMRRHVTPAVSHRQPARAISP